MVSTPPPRTPKMPVNRDENLQERSPAPSVDNPQTIPAQSKQLSEAMSDASHTIDYKIRGEIHKHLEVTLNPNETVIAKPKMIMLLEDGIKTETKINEGEHQKKGFFKDIFTQVKRQASGEKLNLTFFTNMNNKKASATFSSTFPGNILPIDLSKVGKTLFYHEGNFLAATKGATIGSGIKKRVTASFSNSRTFNFMKIQGSSLAFIASNGDFIEKTLTKDEIIYVEADSLLAFQPSVQMIIKVLKGAGGIGAPKIFMAILTGPGKVWIQTLPHYRMSETISADMMQLNKAAVKKEQKKMQKQMMKISKKEANKLKNQLKNQ